MFFVYISVIFLNSIIGIGLAQKFNEFENFYLASSFSNALISSIGFNHIFPHAAESFYGTMACSLSFILLMIIEKLILHLHNHIDKNASMFLNMSGIGIHAAIAGLSLGFSSDSTDMLYIFIAIISHKIFATFSLAVKYHNSPYALLAFSFVTPISALIGYYCEFHQENSSSIRILDGISAGTFLYIGLSELLIESAENDVIHTNISFTRKKKLLIVSILCGTIIGIILSSPLVIKHEHEHDHNKIIKEHDDIHHEH